MPKPPDFSLPTIRTLSKRAGETCSKPGCHQVTGGPHSDPREATNLGEAAHIRGARFQKNNRFDSTMTDRERASIQNGIWLCCTHAKEIDTDQTVFTVSVLEEWKRSHEASVMTHNRATLFPTFLNRPSLAIEEIDPPILVVGKKASVSITIRNAGGCPAKNTKARAALLVAPARHVNAPCPALPPTLIHTGPFSKSVIAMGGRVRNVAESFYAMTADQVRMLIDGTWWLYVRVIVKYEGMNGDVYSTERYCRYIFGRGCVDCESHNEAT